MAFFVVEVGGILSDLAVWKGWCRFGTLGERGSEARRLLMGGGEGGWLYFCA